MTTSIKRRLLTGLLSLMVVACLVTLVKNYYDTRHEIQDLLDANLAQSARVLLELSTHELHEQLAYAQTLNPDAEGISEHMPAQVHKYQQEIDFQIWISGNHLAVRSENAPKEAFTNIDGIFEDHTFQGRLWRVYSVADQFKDIRVQVGQFYDERDALSQSISGRLITSFAIMFPLLALIIWFNVDRAMRPLNKIARQIENRHYDNLQPISMSSVPEEAQPMIKAINALFNRLQKAIDNIIQFTANAAHELRTPLAAQKINAQVALSTNNEQRRAEALHEVIKAVDHGTTLVEQLLTLARLDPEGLLQSTESADLTKIAEEQLVQCAAQALKKHIELSLDHNGNSVIIGRSGLVQILIRNLVENAIRYTPEKGQVEVRITGDKDHVELCVEDSGPGIPAEERQDVFTRFYRAKDVMEKGTGLGLSIVERIVRIHQADIHLDESRYHGLLVRVKFKTYAAHARPRTLEPLAPPTNKSSKDMETA